MARTVSIIEKAGDQGRLTLLLSIIIFFSVLNGTMFNVAVPDIALEFTLIPSEVSWVITGYIMIFALGSVTYGKLADSYPVKDLVTIGLLLFNAGSLLGFFSRGYPMLVIARLLQAGGGAAIPALAMLVATKYFPVGIKGRVLGVISSTVALGAGMGPVLGGFITNTFHWRYLFLITVTTLLTIPFFRQVLPDEETCRDGFDMTGLLLMGGVVASFLFFVTKLLWWLLPCGTMLLVWFILHIRRTEFPFVTPDLFSNRLYRSTVITAFLAMGTVFGMLFMIPIMLKALNALNANQIGLVMFPGAICGAILGTFGGKLADRIGGVPVVYMGLGLLMSGYLGLSTYAGSGPVVISLCLMICYVGFTFAQSSLTHTVSTTLPGEVMGIGMGIYNLLFFMSGAFSAAILGKLLDLKASRLAVNPFLLHFDAALYSNLFILLIATVLSSAGLFCLSFRRKGLRG